MEQKLLHLEHGRIEEIMYFIIQIKLIERFVLSSHKKCVEIMWKMLRYTHYMEAKFMSFLQGMPLICL